MSAPPLPEVFGNYALGDFVEVVSPAGVSWWPQTVGWLWLGAGLLAYLGLRLWRFLRHWYRNRYRREAIARLQADAREAGFALCIASSFRSYQRQRAIWEGKAGGTRPVYDDAGRQVKMAGLPAAERQR